jgi:aminopeptidase
MPRSRLYTPDVLTFDERLDNLATVALRVGVNLQPGQRMVLISPLEAAPLVRRLVAQAYDLGAEYVYVHLIDDAIGLTRAQRARDDTLDVFPQEYADMLHAMVARGDAYLRVDGSDPDLYASVDPVRLGRMTRAGRRATRPVSDLVQQSYMPWSIVPYAVPAWAAKVFPDRPAGEALDRLWDAVFAATRCDVYDPLGAWEAHVAALRARAALLGAHDFAALHLRGPGTDLRVGLARGHVWGGGGTVATVNGLHAVHNLPTEEVFTAPHARLADGVVRASKPLSYQGQLIEGFSLTFEGGAVVDHAADRGRDVLKEIFDTDEGSRRLGEVALVPHSSPISQSGLLFFDTLFDENAASHLALGRAYETTIRGGLERPLEELQGDGFNDSLSHVDFMVGSGELDVDGVQADGVSVPLMRAGEWVDAG